MKKVLFIVLVTIISAVCCLPDVKKQLPPLRPRHQQHRLLQHETGFSYFAGAFRPLLQPPTHNHDTISNTTAVADTGQTWNLKFSYHTPPQASLVSTYLKPWTAAIEQATNGRVKITHYAGETLVKAKDQYDGLVSGLSDIAAG